MFNRIVFFSNKIGLSLFGCAEKYTLPSTHCALVDNPSLPLCRHFFGKKVVADFTFTDQFCKVRLHRLPDNRFQLLGGKDRSVSLYEHFFVLFQKLGKGRKWEAIQMISMRLFGHTIRGHNMKNHSTLTPLISSFASKENPLHLIPLGRHTAFRAALFTSIWFRFSPSPKKYFRKVKSDKIVGYNAIGRVE